MTNAIYQKRAQRIRNKLKSINTDRFRLTIFRSSKNISAQIIDDKNNKTLISASSLVGKKSDKRCILSLTYSSLSYIMLL